MPRTPPTTGIIDVRFWRTGLFTVPILNGNRLGLFFREKTDTCGKRVCDQLYCSVFHLIAETVIQKCLETTFFRLKPRVVPARTLYQHLTHYRNRSVRHRDMKNPSSVSPAIHCHRTFSVLHLIALDMRLIRACFKIILSV